MKVRSLLAGMAMEQRLQQFSDYRERQEILSVHLSEMPQVSDYRDRQRLLLMQAAAVQQMWQRRNRNRSLTVHRQRLLAVQAAAVEQFSDHRDRRQRWQTQAEVDLLQDNPLPLQTTCVIIARASAPLPP